MLALAVTLITPQTQIDAVLDRPEFKGAIIGAKVVELGGEILYSRNGDTLLMPASNQKLFTVAYALETLGPAYRPKTSFWKTPDGLTLASEGDPSMTFAKLVEVRKKLGIKPGSKIRVVQKYNPGFGPGWEWDDLPNRYAPWISALSFEGNSFELWGDPRRFWIKPWDFGVTIRHFQAPGTNTFDLFSKRLIVRGNRPKSAGFIEAFALPNPHVLAARVLGGVFVEWTEVPKSKPDLAVTGNTIAELAKDCLPKSDNFIAESLLWMAATKSGPIPKSDYEIAGKRFREFLTKSVGIDASEIDPFDGSGLSRHNGITADSVIELLNWAKKRPWVEVWLASLAKPGIGTLKSRLADTSFSGKTGTLHKVSSLSGYVTTKDGRELAISLIFNHYLASDSQVRAAQDEIVRILETTTKNGPHRANVPLHAHPVPHQSNRVANGNRLPGYDFHFYPPRPWAHHRVEPPDAALYRAE